MSVPHAEVRAIEIGLLLDLLRSVQRAYFPDTPFHEAVGLVVLTGAIVRAQASGQPVSGHKLARELEMPRATLLRRLAELEAKGIVAREGNEVRFSGALLATPGAGLIRHTRTLILEAAAALSKMDRGKNPH
jgi:hypothetical protein